MEAAAARFFKELEGLVGDLVDLGVAKRTGGFVSPGLIDYAQTVGLARAARNALDGMELDKGLERPKRRVSPKSV